ncbi:lectin BRA-3-like [Neocloeon triangulifer]|uniref:lectin BRA-3-like n=1 Tax=Neocloeon triangulifer TaxID=2078957 RepID=UPI00286F6181|nr:lectin BRA-3-like [Neocloeon triangulifer]
MFGRQTCRYALHLVFIFSSVLQISLGLENKSEGSFRDYVEIEGITYYVSTGFVNRENAFSECRVRGMNLVSFEGGQWMSVASWLRNNGLSNNWFWTGGLRPENSPTWIWESSGQPITDFHWEHDQPSGNGSTSRFCIDFNLDFGGWDDDDCLSNYYFGYICK